MKTCNSSRVIYHNHHRRHHHHRHHHPQQEYIIRNVPTRLEDDSSTSSLTTTSIAVATTSANERKGEGCRSSSNHTTKLLENFSLIAQIFIFYLILSSSIHQATGSHLPTSYLVQKSNSNSNSNEEYQISINEAKSHEQVTTFSNEIDASKGTSDTTTATDATFEVLPQPSKSVENDQITTNFSESLTTTITTKQVPTLAPPTFLSSTASPATTSGSPASNSYEDNNDSALNYLSDHDHYDEYAAMKAALEKGKNFVENEKPLSTQKSERHPYLLQAADGRKYASIEALCDNRHMTIYGHFDDIFKGRIYALGYSDESECGASNAKEHSHNITFALPLGSCGVQMLTTDDNLENDLRHEVTLYIQYSAFLQQIVDEKISVSCTEIKKSPVEEYLASNEEVVVSSRQGRRMGNIGDSGKYGSTKISSRIGESWMEILAGKDPSPKSRKLSPVSVGEDVTLVISTKVLRGYDARIVNCSAHDGSRTGTIDGSRAQQILDSAGCSLDRSLVPNLRRRRLPIESRNRLITLHFATFQAFKFPERDHLHIKCAVAYCQGPCPQEPCDSVLNHFGSWRDKYGRIADVLIDSTEVVNSVEVIAPELEDLGRGQHYERQSSVAQSGSYSSLSSGNSVSPAMPSEISGRQFSSDHTSSYNSYSSNNAGSSSAAPSAAASAGQSIFGNNQDSYHQISPNGEMHLPVGNSVCVSPGTVILALVILGVVLVISATATLWFALKRSEMKKYSHVKHSPFQHAPQPYYRFSHW